MNFSSGTTARMLATLRVPPPEGALTMLSPKNSVLEPPHTSIKHNNHPAFRLVVQTRIVIYYPASFRCELGMEYWIDLFTGKTWEEFKTHGANVAGFSAKMRSTQEKLVKGDVLLCYMVGVMRWVGALEVIGPSSNDEVIWKGDGYPVRIDVIPLVLLNAETGIPMADLEGKVDFYSSPTDKGKYKGFVRSSPSKFKVKEDGDTILGLIVEASKIPIVRPVDPKKLAYTPVTTYKVEHRIGTKTQTVEVSLPEPEDATIGTAEEQYTISVDSSNHTRMQYFLLQLGANLGFDVWIARNDKSRMFQNQQLCSMPKVIDSIPEQFNQVTTRAIELIDVLWLKGHSIIAAFEVECTTSVYSGLLRMSDLLALQPNLDIKLYIVAPDSRKDKVRQEILRPTFTKREHPLNAKCAYIPESVLLKKVQGLKDLGVLSSLKPDFLESIAIFF